MDLCKIAFRAWSLSYFSNCVHYYPIWALWQLHEIIMLDTHAFDKHLFGSCSIYHRHSSEWMEAEREAEEPWLLPCLWTEVSALCKWGDRPRQGLGVSKFTRLVSQGDEELARVFWTHHFSRLMLQQDPASARAVTPLRVGEILPEGPESEDFRLCHLCNHYSTLLLEYKSSYRRTISKQIGMAVFQWNSIDKAVAAWVRPSGHRFPTPPDSLCVWRTRSFPQLWPVKVPGAFEKTKLCESSNIWIFY